MISKLINAITIKRTHLFLAVIILVVACIAGCTETADMSDRTEGMAERNFRNQMADAGVEKIAVNKDLVLQSPVEINGTKVIYGEGSITAVGNGWAGDDYMIIVPSGSKLTVNGSVLINANGITGGVYAAQNAVWSIEETASVNNASPMAANTLVEGRFYMNGGTMSGAMGHNIHNEGEVVFSNGEIIGSGTKHAGIYSEGSLTQDGGIIRDAYNNVVVFSGVFNFNAGSNQNSARDGIYVAEGAKLYVTAKAAIISGSGVRGIYLCGEAAIDNITLDKSGDSLIKISQSGVLNLNGGTLADAGYHSIENAGKVMMTGGIIRNSYNCGIVNTGTLEVTGGSFVDNVNNKAILNKHDGKATVSGGTVMFSGNRFAVGNEDQATLDLSGAEILLTTGTNIYAYGGTVNIHDISLGASGSNNVRIYKADVTMTNVQVLGNSSSGSSTTHGILLEGGVLKATDLEVRNTTGYGIRNKGGNVTIENLLISNSIKAGGISNMVQDYTGVPGIMDIKDLTVEDIRYNNVVVEGGTLTITNGQLKASGTNNTKITDGTLHLKNVEIHGNLPDVDGTNHAVYSTGGILVAENVMISGGKVTGLRVNGETAVIKGKNVTIQNNAKYGIDLTVGQINIDGLAMNGNYYNITTNGGNIQLRNSNLGATISNNVRINKGAVVDLQNVVIKGHMSNHPDNVHALFVDNGKLTGEKVTVSNVATVGLRVKGGTAEIQGFTVEDAGGDGVWIDSGRATLHNLVIKKAGAAGISATNTGDITVFGGSISHTVSHGVKSENEANLSLKDVSVGIATTDGRHAVLAQGGDIYLENVKITGNEQNANGFGIRINRDTSHVSGQNIHIADVNTGVNVVAGTANISGLTTQDIAAHSAYAAATGNLEISDSEFGVTGSNNAKAENGGKLTLNKTVIQGTAKNHGIMVENGGYFIGKDITVRDTVGCAVRIKCSAEGNNVEIDGLVTENIGVHNVYINKDEDAGNFGSVVIKNADLCRTGTHSVLAEAGNLTLIDTKLQGHLEGTANNLHTIYLTQKVNKVNLENVTVLDTSGDALRIGAGDVQVIDFISKQAGRNGIWADGGKLAAENITISDSKNIGVYVTAQVAVQINGADISGSGANNISVVGAELTVNGYTDGSKSQIGTTIKDNVVVTDAGAIRLNNVNVLKSAANNIVATKGEVYLTDVTVTGGNYSILVQDAAYAELSGVTITDPVKDAIRVNKADGKVVVNNVQIVDPVRYGISAEKGTVVLSGELTISSDAKKSSAIYAYNGGIVTAAEAASVVLRGTENGICVESDAKVALHDVSISECAINGVKVTSGIVVINGIAISGSGSNNVLVSGGELTVNGYTNGNKSQIGASTADNVVATGTGVVRLNNLNVLASAKNNVVAITGGTVHMKDSVVNGGNHSVLADNAGTVYLNNVQINDSANSGIRANSAGSYVEATDLTIVGAKTGLSIKCGTVKITNITVRNTKEVGISVAQSTSAANVTLNNLVAENCGTNAIYTSGADAKLTVNGAILGNDGSDHVINLNGGPMVLNDVTINGENLVSGKYELYSGAGWLTIGGAMDADIHIDTDPGRVIKVNKELTGNNLVVDWKTAPTGNALEFADAAMLNASKDHIKLGSIQSASSEFQYEEKTAKLKKLEIYTTVNSWSELTAMVSAMTSGSYMDYRIAGNASDWVANATLTIPEGVQVRLSPDGNAPAIEVASGVSPFAFEGNTVLTLENLVVGGTASAKAAHIIVPKTATLNLNNTTLQYFAGERGGAVHVNCGTLTADGATFANNSNPINWGGAVGIWGGTVNISNSLFTGNTSKNSGGAIINYKADGSSYGGITDNTVGTLTLTNCVFTKNTTSEHGGAVASWAGGTTTITDCVFGDENDAAMGNSVTKNGGAIHVQESHKMTVTNCKFFSNSAAGEGGAIYSKSSAELSVTGSSFKNNVATGNGGAILLLGSAQICDSVFTGNSGKEGGAISLATGFSLTLHNVACADNTTTRTNDLSSYGYGDIRVADNTANGIVTISGKIVATIWNNQAHGIKITGALAEGSNAVIDWRLGKLTANKVGIVFDSEESMNASKAFIKLGIDASTTEKWVFQYSATEPWQATLVKAQ